MFEPRTAYQKYHANGLHTEAICFCAVGFYTNAVYVVCIDSGVSGKVHTGELRAMKEPEHLGIKINKAISTILAIIAAALVLVAAFFFIKAALA